MLKYFRLVGLTLLLSVGVGSVGKAASFDCNKATTETEIAICADPDLSALDELMAEAYTLAKAANASPHCKQSRMELFANLCGAQANELLLADQKRWLNNRNVTQTPGALFDKMYRRTIELSSGAIGQNFQKILKLLSSLDSLPDEHVGKAYTKFIDFDVFHNRVITFKTFKNGSSTYLFDTNGKLARVFLSQEFTEDACQNYHSIFDRNFDSKYDKLAASIKCFGYDQHFFTQSFILTHDCIELIAASKSDRLSNEQWKLNAGERRCVEHDNFNIEFPSLEGLNSNTIYFENETEADISTDHQIDTCDGSEGRSSLHFIAKQKDTRLLKKILEQDNSNINCVDDYGETPLHFAAALGTSENVSLLLKYGANPNLINTGGETPLDLALENLSLAGTFALSELKKLTTIEVTDK